MVTELKPEQFEDFVAANPQGVVVDVWAPWCGPCRALAPVFEQTATELSGVAFAKLNADDPAAMDLCVRLGIRSVPTVVVAKAGEVPCTVNQPQIATPGLKAQIEACLAR